MKFLADAMLGKLAKWLRMLGYDTLYFADSDDDELIRIAIRDDRILLTRDELLCRRRMVRARCFFVDWGSTGEQVRQVMKHFNLKLSRENLFTRCTICNGDIIPISKSDIADRIPPYVYKTQNEFGYCERCDKIYWRGTHIEHVLDSLQKEI